jgi:hypothetical protein
MEQRNKEISRRISHSSSCPNYRSPCLRTVVVDDVIDLYRMPIHWQPHHRPVLNQIHQRNIFPNAMDCSPKQDIPS